MITSIETLAKQKLKPYNVENVKFDHKRYMSHIFADFKDGKQQIEDGVYGKSITDPCLGWEKTERLVLDLADMLP